MSEPIRWLDDPSSAPALRDALRTLPAEAPELPAAVLDGVATNLRRGASSTGSGAAIAGLLAGLVSLALVLTAMLRPVDAAPSEKTVPERREARQAAPADPAAAGRATDSVERAPEVAPPVIESDRRHTTRAGARTTRERAREAVSTEPATTVASEVELLLRARRALASDPAAALAIAAEHQAAYPRGSHVLEREVVAIDALLRLGRSPEARARRALVDASYPNALYGERIDRLFRDRE
jgi:hypothetical protein